MNIEAKIKGCINERDIVHAEDGSLKCHTLYNCDTCPNYEEKVISVYELIRHVTVRHKLIEKYREPQENLYATLVRFLAEHTEQEAITIMKELRDG